MHSCTSPRPPTSTPRPNDSASRFGQGEELDDLPRLAAVTRGDLARIPLHGVSRELHISEVCCIVRGRGDVGPSEGSEDRGLGEGATESQAQRGRRLPLGHGIGDRLRRMRSDTHRWPLDPPLAFSTADVHSPSRLSLSM